MLDMVDSPSTATSKECRPEASADANGNETVAAKKCTEATKSLEGEGGGEHQNQCQNEPKGEQDEDERKVSFADHQQQQPESKSNGFAELSKTTTTPQQIEITVEQRDSCSSSADLAEQLSPNSSLRRSSRVSALNARKKLQEQQQPDSLRENQQEPHFETEGQHESMVQENSSEETPMAGTASTDFERSQERVLNLKRKLKRKLEDGQQLDQYDCKFGIRLDTQGDVVMMSDESEISSLNEEDVAELRNEYTNSRVQEVSPEVQTSRDLQVRELESALRVEEAKLLMLKKLRQSQQKAALKQQQQEGLRRLAPGVVQNSSGQAYKPKVAVVNPSQHGQGTNAPKINGTTAHGKKGAAKAGADAMHNGIGAALGGALGAGGIQLSSLPQQHQQVIQQLFTRLSQNPQQLAQMIKTLPPPTGHALTELLRQYAVAQATNAQSANSGLQQPPTATNISSAAKSGTQGQSQITQAQMETAQKQARELSQQKVAMARQQMRKELDAMIMKLPAPKAPPPDLQFIPNGNQPDFCYLLGLDLTVQRVLKDKSMFRKMDFPPYQCEECETDFTPSWKAICGEQEDYHLYCERCIRQAQKRKVRLDYTALLKKAFQQVQEREKEFERQVASGKYNVEPVLPTAPSVTTAPSTAVSSKAQTMHNSAAALGQSAALKGAAALQQLGQQGGTPSVLNLSKSATGGTPSGTSLSNTGAKNVSSGQQKTTPAKRSSTNASSSASASANASVANPLAALAQNPHLQQQFATMAALSGSPLIRQMASSPLFAAAMTNPMVMQQLYAAIASQHQRVQPQNTTTTTSTAPTGGNASGNAMAALIQAVQQSSQQQQTRSSASSTATSSAANNQSSTASSASSNNIAQQMAAMAALANPMLALQSQLSQMGGANQQLLSQLSSNPQLLRQFQQLYMAQQMKAGTGAGKK